MLDVRGTSANLPAKQPRRGRKAASTEMSGLDTRLLLWEIERLSNANKSLKRALLALIKFAGPRTAIANDCGDEILDPHVLNAKAVISAVEAG